MKATLGRPVHENSLCDSSVSMFSFHSGSVLRVNAAVTTSMTIPDCVANESLMYSKLQQE